MKTYIVNACIISDRGEVVSIQVTTVTPEYTINTYASRGWLVACEEV